ncbi:MAG: hypothetical protein U0X91_32035 [Spirosomataceae bacterium]
METRFASFDMTSETAAQILPLSALDLDKLEKQKKQLNHVVALIIALFGVYFCYEFAVEDAGVFTLLIMLAACWSGLALGYFLMAGGIRDNINAGVKYTGKAKVVRKRCFKNSYWTELDWHFGKEIGVVYLTPAMYYSIEKGDSVQIEVLPKTKSALSVVKTG